MTTESVRDNKRKTCNVVWSSHKVRGPRGRAAYSTNWAELNNRAHHVMFNEPQTIQNELCGSSLAWAGSSSAGRQVLLPYTRLNTLEITTDKETYMICWDPRTAGETLRYTQKNTSNYNMWTLGISEPYKDIREKRCSRTSSRRKSWKKLRKRTRPHRAHKCWRRHQRTRTNSENGERGWGREGRWLLDPRMTTPDRPVLTRISITKSTDRTTSHTHLHLADDDK